MKKWLPTVATLINYYWDLFLKTVMIVNFQTVILLLYEKWRTKCNIILPYRIPAVEFRKAKFLEPPYKNHYRGHFKKNSYDSKFSNSIINIV